MPRYILTGAPGTGKTTVLAHLPRWLQVVEEPARGIIAEHVAATGEPGLDHRPELFVRRLIERSVDNYHSVPDAQVAVFDRGLPDCVAYAAILDVDPSAAFKAAAGLKYQNQVFIAYPWEEIYEPDDMRRATFSQVEEFLEHLVRAYGGLGYELVELPKVSAAERAAFLRDSIANSSDPRSEG